MSNSDATGIVPPDLISSGAFPNVASKAGARAFPLLIPQTPDAPGAAAGQHVLASLREDRRPTLMLWGDSDPVLPISVAERFAESIGRLGSARCEVPRTQCLRRRGARVHVGSAA